MLNLFLKAICAGVMISVGCLIYITLSPVSLPTAAGLFSISLLTILWYGFKLFTGSVGYASYKKIPRLLLILFGNTIGCLTILLFPSVSYIAASIMEAKRARTLVETFGRAIICGFLIYIAVDQFRYTDRKYAPLIAIPAFVAAEAEHCIANLCLIFASGLAMFNIQNFIFIIVVIFGNAVGSIAFHQIKRRI